MCLYGSSTHLTLVAIVGVIAIVALFMAYVFRREVLAAGDGTVNMQNIAQAVQEGATAFLSRQFRTLGIFAVVAFFLLLALPAHTDEPGAHWGLRIARSVAFLAGAVFSGLIGYLGMWLATRANLRVAAAARARTREAAGDGGAVEAAEELLLVESKPPAERPAGASLPRQTGLRLDSAGRQPEEVGRLARRPGDDGARVDRVAGREATAAPQVVALESADRSIAAQRGERTTTNQSPAWSTSPPPSSPRSACATPPRTPST